MALIEKEHIKFKVDSANITLNLPAALEGTSIPRWKKIFRILKDGCWDEAIETLRNYLPIYEEECQRTYEEAKQYKWPSGDKKTAYVKAQKLHKAFKEYFE